MPDWLQGGHHSSPVIQVSVKHRELPGRKVTRVGGRGWLVHAGPAADFDGGVETWGAGSGPNRGSEQLCNPLVQLVALGTCSEGSHRKAAS